MFSGENTEKTEQSLQNPSTVKVRNDPERNSGSSNAISRSNYRFPSSTNLSLERYFETNPNPSSENINEIAKHVKLTVYQVANWFQRKRKRLNMTRKWLNEEQRNILDNIYRNKRYVTRNEIANIAKRLDLTEERVANWFHVKRRTLHMTSKMLNEEQRNILENIFRDKRYVTREEITAITRRLDLTENRVRTWFNHRRAKDREENKMNTDSRME